MNPYFNLGPKTKLRFVKKIDYDDKAYFRLFWFKYDYDILGSILNFQSTSPYVVLKHLQDVYCSNFVCFFFFFF